MLFYEDATGSRVTYTELCSTQHSLSFHRAGLPHEGHVDYYTNGKLARLHFLMFVRTMQHVTIPKHGNKPRRFLLEWEK